MEIKGPVFNDLKILQAILDLAPKSVGHGAVGGLAQVRAGPVRVAGRMRSLTSTPAPPAPMKSAANEKFELNQVNDLVTQSLQVYPHSRPLHQSLVHGVQVQQFCRTRGKDVSTTTRENGFVFKVIADRKDSDGNNTAEVVFYGIGDTADEAGMNALGRINQELHNAYTFSSRNSTSGSICQSVASVSSRR